jgi:tetratricopeptide (TPR) repeat protein
LGGHPAQPAGRSNQRAGLAPVDLRELLKGQASSLSLEIEHAGAQYNKAITLYRLGRYEQALHALERARQLDQGNALTLAVLGGWRLCAPDCDLVNRSQNGECGQMQNLNFGLNVPTTHYTDELRDGFGVRPYNWESTIGVQHELTPGVSVNVSYSRRVFTDFTATQNVLVGQSRPL